MGRRNPHRKCCFFLKGQYGARWQPLVVKIKLRLIKKLHGDLMYAELLPIPVKMEYKPYPTLRNCALYA